MDAANVHALAMISTDHVLAALDVAVLVRMGPFHYRVVGDPPGFFKRLFVEELPEQERAHPWESYPMLDFFLQQAEPFWLLNSRSRLVRGPWVHTDSSGTVYPIQMTAMCVDGRHLLLLKHLGREYDRQQKALEQMREAMIGQA